jgi:serine/threonine protein kinase
MESDPPVERRRRSQEIVAAARALPESDRAEFLDAACSEDRALRAEVQALLEEPESASLTPARYVPAEIAQLGPYRLVRPIGSGGMGVVYEATDTRLHRRVAVKVLSGMGIDEAAGNERFLREARAASALEHPNICSIYDVGETADGRLYIVMAYYAGETLRDKLMNGPLPID